MRRFLNAIRAPILILFLIWVAVMSNWIFKYVEVQRSGRTVATPVDTGEQFIAAVVRFAGGWPLKYYTRSEYTAGPPVIQSNWLNLVFNILFWLVAYLIALLYEVSMRPGIQEDGTRPKRQMALLDIFVLTSLLALALAYWRLLDSRSRAAESLVREIAKTGGSAVQAAFLPEPLARHLTARLHGGFLRLTEVSLTAPDSALLMRIVEVPYLTRLHLGGGDYDLRILDRLVSKPLFCELRLSGRKLDATTLTNQCTVDGPTLEKLSDSRSNLIFEFMNTDVSPQLEAEMLMRGRSIKRLTLPLNMPQAIRQPALMRLGTSAFQNVLPVEGEPNTAQFAPSTPLVEPTLNLQKL